MWGVTDTGDASPKEGKKEGKKARRKSQSNYSSADERSELATAEALKTAASVEVDAAEVLHSQALDELEYQPCS